MVGKSLEVFHRFRIPPELRELSFLQELERTPLISQRELSNRFGIALGVTNACIREMTTKGWVEIRALDHRRNGYHLTPLGTAEMGRLTRHVIAWTVQQYGTAKAIIMNRLVEMTQHGVKRLVFYGVGEEMEIALMAIRNSHLELMGIVEDDGMFQPQILWGFELEPVSRVTMLKPEGILITSLKQLERRRDTLKSLIDFKSVRVSDLCL
jgi:hypothetical protein